MSEDQYVEGPISISTRPSGYIKDPKTEEDIEIQGERLNKALHKDEVRVRILKEKVRDRRQGEVVEVLKRNKTKFVGVLEEKNGSTYINPDNKKIYLPLKLNLKESLKAKINDKVYFDITSFDDDLEIEIIEVIGQKGIHNVEMKAIVLDKGFDVGFDQEIENEAFELKKIWSKVPEEEIKLRRDLRNVTTFTIDPKSAKDFDDALSIKYLDNGNFEIGIHIADVSHFVKRGSAIDKEARDRSFSVYLVDRTIPMLPEILSNDLCSLNPNEDKLSFSAIFEMNPNAEVINSWFGKTIINSDKRFTYEEAQESLDKNEGEFIKELNTLYEIAKILRKRKLDAGAIRFEKDEFEFVLDENGVPVSIIKKEHIDTHWLIEEFMLLANRNVAKFLVDMDNKLSGERDNDLIFRVHPAPEVDKIKELNVFLKALKKKELYINDDGQVSAKDINALFDSVKGLPEEGLVTSATIKTMSKAIYTTKNSGHFGLAFKYYTHFTSPIRRYPDLIVHRILDKFTKNTIVDNHEALEFPYIADHATNQEIASAEAERDSIKYKQIEFMQNHIGDKFTGVISGVTKWGIYVLLDDTGADGMVHISKLGDDYYNFDQKNYRIIGEKTNVKFTLGDKVTVKVDGADVEERKLDLSFVTPQK